MNEDDTFNALRRTPIEEMMPLLTHGMTQNAGIDLLKQHGWVIKEFGRQKRLYLRKKHEKFLKDTNQI